MQVRLLGPVDVMVDGTPRQVPGLRRKAVLAVLALQPGEVVSTGRLIDVVWGDAAPATVENTLQSHVSHLRRVLGAEAAIRTRPPGYALDLGDEATDVQAAERLIQRGTQSADPAKGASQIQAAIALWRGPPLTDIAGLAWFGEQAQRLEHLLLRARQALIDLRLALGQHAQVVSELESLSQQHPLDEQICGQLMRALYRCGRQADALAAYQRIRRTLGDDLGLDPGQRLRDLEAAIVHQDPALDASRPTQARAAGITPAQLPPAVAAFAGRRQEIPMLDRLLAGSGGASAALPAVVISAIAGTAGVGKTALAVHWAHRVRGQFPDGQLYVNLRGFDPDGQAMSPEVAVRGFLDAFGVPPERIPAGLDAQAGLYRSLLADRRVLVLLDNARDAEQVRPLLPGAAGCLAVVTSRDRLAGLVATAGAHPLSLDLLTAAEARDLLAGRLGLERLAAEPHAVDGIIIGTSALPLALAIVAARAATHLRFPLTALAAELHETRTRLDALDGPDQATQLRAVFSWSYRTLRPDAARMFRMLGLHPGPDVTARAAASLAGIPVPRAEQLLAELGRAHLVTERRHGRYTSHDLLRAYAAELAHTEERDPGRRAATGRMLDHYLHTAYRGDRLLDPARDPIRLPDAAAVSPPRRSPATGRRSPGSPPSTPCCWVRSAAPPQPDSTLTRGGLPGR